MIGGSVGPWVGRSMGKWSVVGWTGLGGSVVVGLNKTPTTKLKSTFKQKQALRTIPIPN